MSKQIWRYNVMFVDPKQARRPPFRFYDVQISAYNIGSISRWTCIVDSKMDVRTDVQVVWTDVRMLECARA